MPAASTHFDRTNNVEQVAWKNVPAGSVTVVVSAHKVTLRATEIRARDPGVMSIYRDGGASPEMLRARRAYSCNRLLGGIGGGERFQPLDREGKLGDRICQMLDNFQSRRALPVGRCPLGPLES